ncbi:hypothetical protein FRX31_013434 [Thalictrum thalictroides]|uniref:Uncharacterized protein n=1 Tax=Thalictrum thalictroides TaxID=46969 RepID=A0A7J6WJ96_THATH|nr:hypothetical protein FRX31_013434 [Thalictrum thalictroides]
MELAGNFNWNKIWIETDSEVVANSFLTNYVPWQLKSRWYRACKRLQEWRITHIYSEANFSADQMAKRAAGLMKGEEEWHWGRPQFLTVLEVPHHKYFRFH